MCVRVGVQITGWKSWLQLCKRNLTTGANFKAGRQDEQMINRREAVCEPGQWERLESITRPQNGPNWPEGQGGVRWRRAIC